MPEIVSEIINLLTSLDVSRLRSWFGVLPDASLKFVIKTGTSINVPFVYIKNSSKNAFASFGS